jgi:hypothetical protein
LTKADRSAYSAIHTEGRSLASRCPGFHETLNMNEQFELIYGFIHCRGKTTYHAGYVDTEAQAEAWVRDHREGTSRTVKIPLEDPISYCKAALCPLKRQKPWFAIVPHS